MRHGTAYDRLPDWLVALDLWHPRDGFADVADRDARCTDAGLTTPPRPFTGVLEQRQALLVLLGPSRYSSTQPAEGLVLRSSDGRQCKLMAPGFARRDDAAWTSTHERNTLAQEGSVRR